MEQVYQEIAILKKLDHPNVVKLVEVRWKQRSGGGLGSPASFQESRVTVDNCFIKWNHFELQSYSRLDVRHAVSQHQSLLEQILEGLLDSYCFQLLRPRTLGIWTPHPSRR